MTGVLRIHSIIFGGIKFIMIMNLCEMFNQCLLKFIGYYFKIHPILVKTRYLFGYWFAMYVRPLYTRGIGFFIIFFLFIYTIFKEDTQLASKASLPCGPL